MKRKYLTLFSLSGLVLCVDQITKAIVQSKLPEGYKTPLIPRLVGLTHLHNSGFAFGLWGHVPERFQDIFFIGVPIFALVLIVLIFIKLQDGQYLTSVALTTILSGAVGNLIDRIQFGYVTDILEIHVGDLFHFPAFNIADGSIIVGVSIMFFHTLLTGGNRARP